MKTLKIEALITYDDKLMHSGKSDPEARDWFFEEVMHGNDLILHSNEIGDTVGKVKVLAVHEII